MTAQSSISGWQARRHAASHPPVISPYALLRSQTVADLRAYLQTTMPWYAPDLLDDETYCPNMVLAVRPDDGSRGFERVNCAWDTTAVITSTPNGSVSG